MEEIRRFLERINELISWKEEISNQKGENFNVFKLCGVYHYENSHSDIIAEFLNPKGSHGCGNDFLLAFCRIVGLDASQYENADVDVTREHQILGGSGRVDIIIEAGTSKIIIENKIYANEGDGQLRKYRDWLDNNSGKKAPLFFLTLDGRKSNDKGMKGLYTPISYESYIIPWLNECIHIAVEKPFVRESLIQYKNLVEDLVKGNLMNFDETLITTITNNFESAIKVARSFDIAKAYLLATQLTRELKKAGFTVREDVDGSLEQSITMMITSSGPDYNVIFSASDPDRSIKYEIELGFDRYYFWRSRTLLRFLDLKKCDIKIDVEKLIKNPTILKASNWKMEDSQDSLTFSNHDNTLVLSDETFKGLAAKDSSREATIEKILKNYQARKNDAVDMAKAVLDFIAQQK